MDDEMSEDGDQFDGNTRYRIADAADVIHRSDICLVAIGSGSAFKLTEADEDDRSSLDGERISRLQRRWYSFSKCRSDQQAESSERWPSHVEAILRWREKYWADPLVNETWTDEPGGAFAMNGIVTDSSDRAYTSSVERNHFYCLTSRIDVDIQKLGIFPHVFPIYGNISMAQCSNRCSSSTWEWRPPPELEGITVVPSAEIQVHSSRDTSEESLSDSIPGVVRGDPLIHDNQDKSRTVVLDMGADALSFGRCILCGAVDRPNIWMGEDDQKWAANVNSWRQFMEWVGNIEQEVVDNRKKLVILALDMLGEDIGLSGQLEWLMALLYRYSLFIIHIGEQAMAPQEHRSSSTVIDHDAVEVILELDSLLEKKGERMRFDPL